MKRKSKPTAAPVAAPHLTWIHDGFRYRATVWPDVQFLRESAPEVWDEVEPSEGALASATLGVSAERWRQYLEYVPAAEREFVERFQFARMVALLVVVRCPALRDELAAAPALTLFLGAHRSLRGGEAPGWAELAAVHEREGIYGVLQWLGLPSSRQTLRILRNIADPDVPRRLLEPLRSALWEPEAIWALTHERRLTDERLAATCQAMAA